LAARADAIEHVVVLMLENRSFDHMLGDLGIAGVERPGRETANPLRPDDPAGPAYEAQWITGDEDVSVDPGHGYIEVMRQLTATDSLEIPAGGLTNKGFVWSYAGRLQAEGASVSRAAEIMHCSHTTRVPVLSTLAREFAVCTRWFCSLPSETWPNRLFAHAAQSDNLVTNVVRRYEIRSIFDTLRDAGVSWGVYAGDIPQSAAFMRRGDFFRRRFHPLADFFSDVARGNLPHYSFLEPSHFGPWADSQHPTQRVWRGERLLKRVYEALAANHEIWHRVLFIVTYDEHGGFYDHVPPPPADPPHEGDRDPEHGFEFNLLGPRVPAVVVSPTARRGADSTVRDHASIVKTIREVFDIPTPLTDRDAGAASVLGLLDGPRRDAPPLPPVARERDTAPGLEGLEGLEVSHWAEGVRPDGTIRFNELQEGLLELKRQLDEQEGGHPGLESVATPPTGYTSTAQLESTIEDFRRQHMQTAGAA
jgi:phospholipase C